jgi:dethiobiotin synthetase
MPKGFFITGTDTDVGKTVLSALLCTSLPAYYWKPIQTGAREGTDREQVIRLAGMTSDLALPEAYVFDDPVSPHLAAQRSGQEICLERLSLPGINSDLPLIVEGAGGVMVPVNPREFMRDLMRRLDLPVVLASRSTLGTINHTLLSIAALRDAGLEIRGVVLIGPEDTDNLHAIENYGGVRVIGHIPTLQVIRREMLAEIFARRFVREAFL